MIRTEIDKESSLEYKGYIEKQTSLKNEKDSQTLKKVNSSEFSSTTRPITLEEK